MKGEYIDQLPVGNCLKTNWMKLKSVDGGKPALV